MALIEAMAAGCPVIATSVGGIPATLRHGVNGWLVPPKDVAALETGIALLLDQPTLRQELGTSGRATFLARYSAVVMTRRYEALYERRPQDANVTA